MTFENINFTLSTNYFILTILMFIAVGYSYYIYKYTIPQTSWFTKTLLITLRSSALIMIIIILFEPVLTLNYIRTNKPVNLLLIDNSSSIVNKDSTSRAKKIHNFIESYKNTISDNTIIATFGNGVNQIDNRNISKLKFNAPVTNFEKLIPFIKNQKKNIATITMVTDGIITEGSNSTSEIEKLNIPVFTVAVGDTTKPSDIAISKVLFNKLIYLNSKTEINGVISNSNFANRIVTVSLFDESGVVGQKQIKLNEYGINNITFAYKPKEIGKNNLLLKVSGIEKEETYVNNKYPFIIDVLNNKTNVLLLAGAPSADLSVIVKSLSENSKIILNKIVQLNRTTFLDKNNYTNKIDSAEIILMIDFPTTKTPVQLLNRINRKITLGKTPYFLFLSELTNYNRLTGFKNLLPFKTKTFSQGYLLTQPEIISVGNGIFNNLSLWNQLAPIKTNNSKIEVKSYTSLLAVGKSRNDKTELPILFTSKLASSRSIIFNGYDFWKWRVQPDAYLENTFNTFLSNSIKWLSTKKEKRIFVKPLKDIFTTNETVEFSGNVYDETLTPINNATVVVEISSDNFKKSIKLQPVKNGIYKGSLGISSPGTFKYTAKINSKDEKQQIVKGKFLISDLEIENINFILNSNYLTFISNVTSGSFFTIDDYSNLFSKIKQFSNIQIKKEVLPVKFDIWRNRWILFLIIIFFAIEWIIRKQRGML